MEKIYKGFAEFTYSLIPYLIFAVIALDILIFTGSVPMSAYNPIFEGNGYARSVIGYMLKKEVVITLIGVNVGMIVLAVPRFIGLFHKS